MTLARLMPCGVAIALTWAGPAAAQDQRIAQRLELREGAIELAVRFDRGEEPWASYVMERSAQFLAAAERFLDASLHRAAKNAFPDGVLPRAIEIAGAKQVTLGGRRMGAYNNLAGYYPGARGVFVEYGLAPRGNPALVLHELGHLWFYVSAAQRPGAGAPWFVEGAASALPLALAEAGELALRADEIAAIRRHWGVGWTPARALDLPVAEDLRLRGGDFAGVYYSKTLKLLLLVRRELGAAAYAALLRRAAAAMPLASDEAVLALLGEAKRADWRELLSGWLNAGPYRRVELD